MPYISEVPDSLLTFDVDAWVIDTNNNQVLNDFIRNEQETTGDISATNQGGNGGIAEPGETVTVPTASGDISGEYIGPAVISTQNASVGIPGLANLDLVVNDIEGHLIRADDGTVYLISDDQVSEDHLSATASITILGQQISVDAPVSEITDALVAEINGVGQAAYQTAYNTAYAANPLLPEPLRVAAADAAGDLAQAPWNLAAGTVGGATNLIQGALDTVILNVAEGDGTLGVVCFARGTLIDTQRGEVAVEELRKGDFVLTLDNGPKPILWIGSIRCGRRTLARHANLRPIRIAAGALGNGTPVAALLVSPQHRVLVRSKIAQRMFGVDEILVAAKQLLGVSGITVAEDVDEVEYFHFLFDHHEIVRANGAAAESLFTGREAMKSIGDEARKEIFALFPELQQPEPLCNSARYFPQPRMARRLAARHVQNNRALVI